MNVFFSENDLIKMSILLLNVWVRFQANTDRARSHGGDVNVQTVT